MNSLRSASGNEGLVENYVFTRSKICLRGAVISEKSLGNFLKRFLLHEKFVPLVVIRFFITISLTPERIVGSTFRKK